MTKKGQHIKPGSLKGGKNQPFPGKHKFKSCEKEMRGKKGVRNPAGLCAALNRAKYGGRGKH